MARLRSLSIITGILLTGTSLRSADFDHGSWNDILEATVDEAGWVDYQAIQKTRASKLKSYLRELSKASLSNLSVAEKKAFWINAYNAICVQTLIDHDLPDEVPHATFFGANIFTETTYRVAGKVRSLDEIEHEILRKQFKDNRVHAAIVCGASSCPRLRPEAYSGADLDRQLNEEARRWIQEGRTLEGKRKNYLDRKRKTFYVSKIFDWFDEDFGGNDAGTLRFVKRFASESDRQFLSKNRVSVRYLTYSWRRNQKDRTKAR